MAAMTTQHCACCGAPFQARLADVRRGWARFCSKSCKAKKQEARTGQYRALIARSEDRAHQQAMDDATAGWDEGGWLSDDSGVSA